jgi:signal transduction histidine kinase
VFVRDALLDTDRASLPQYQREVETAYRRADRALREYVPIHESVSDRENVTRLRKEVDNLRTAMFDVLSSDNGRSSAEVGALLGLVMPRRDAAIRIAEELQVLNRNAYVQHQAERVALYGSLQVHFWEILGGALLASLGIAVLASTYAGRLERDLRHKQAKEEQSRRELQRLSAKLTTAQEEERRAIARELHDEVGQLLTAIKMELAMAEHTLKAEGGSANALQNARSIADGALHTVRDLSRLLHPALLDDLGLPVALDTYLKSFGERQGLRTELRQEGMGARLPSATEVAAYRIVQEALTNVAKHARASECRVSLCRRPETVLVTIEDNGVGIDRTRPPGSVVARGLGLISIRERVAQLNGTITIESTRGHGTRLVVELPAREAPAERVADPHASGTTEMRGAVAHG